MSARTKGGGAKRLAETERISAFCGYGGQSHLEMKERFCRLCHALNFLPETQGRRVEAHFLLGMKRWKTCVWSSVPVL